MKAAAMKAAPLLETKQLSRHFSVGGSQLVAVNRVDLQIAEGEVLGLVGESGSGKSTLGKLLVGLLDKTAGDVYYQGQLLPRRYKSQDFARHAKQMQMIFQDPYGSLNPRMTVLELVAEGLILAGSRTAASVKSQVIEILQLVGLSADCLSRYPHEFSGGQRQRLGIARALVVNPRFIVCDEPISALDLSIQAQVINLLGEIKKRLNLTLLFIAHDLSMVRYISDRIVVMYRGVIVESGPADAVFAMPKHPYTEALIAANPVADPQLEKNRRHQLLSGEITEQFVGNKGCVFANRCPKVMAECKHCSTNIPAVTIDSTNGHSVACLLYK